MTVRTALGTAILAGLMVGVAAPRMGYAADPPSAPAQQQVRFHFHHGHHRHRHHHHTYYRPHFFWPIVIAPEPVYVYPDDTADQSGDPSAVLQQQSVNEPLQPEPLGLSLAINFLALNTTDTQLTYDTIEGANLFGLGGALRYDLATHFMIEGGLGIVGSEADGIQQVSVPITVSVLPHLFPGEVFDPYALAGLGVMVTGYDDPDFGDREQFAQLLGQVGAGVEINIGELVLQSDLRLLGLQARPDRESLLPLGDDSEPEPSPSDVTVRDGSTPPAPVTVSDPDDVIGALQFNLGIGLRF